MKNNPDFYYFGKCKYCQRWSSLKNGICLYCDAKRPKLPEGFEELFGKFKGINNE